MTRSIRDGVGRRGLALGWIAAAVAACLIVFWLPAHTGESAPAVAEPATPETLLRGALALPAGWEVGRITWHPSGPTLLAVLSQGLADEEVWTVMLPGAKAERIFVGTPAADVSHQTLRPLWGEESVLVVGTDFPPKLAVSTWVADLVTGERNELGSVIVCGPTTTDPQTGHPVVPLLVHGQTVEALLGPQKVLLTDLVTRESSGEYPFPPGIVPKWCLRLPDSRDLVCLGVDTNAESGVEVDVFLASPGKDAVLLTNRGDLYSRQIWLFGDGKRVRYLTRAPAGTGKAFGEVREITLSTRADALLVSEAAIGDRAIWRLWDWDAQGERAVIQVGRPREGPLRAWMFTLASGSWEELPFPDDRDGDAFRFSPDGRFVACGHGDQILILDLLKDRLWEPLRLGEHEQAD